MSNRQTKEETDRSLGIAPNSAAQDRALIEEIERQIADYKEWNGCYPGNIDMEWLVNNGHALLAHEQQRSQAAAGATPSDELAAAQLRDTGKVTSAADPPRDDLVAKLRKEVITWTVPGRTLPPIAQLCQEAADRIERDAQELARLRCETTVTMPTECPRCHAVTSHTMTFSRDASMGAADEGGK